MLLYEIYGHLGEDAYDDAKVSFAKKFPDIDVIEIGKYTDLYKSKHSSILKKKELPPEAKNIAGWAGKKSKKTWDEFKQFVDGVEVENSNRSTQKADTGNEGDFVDVWEDNNWRVLMPLDHAAAIHFGKYTTWCTTKPGQSHFAYYVFKQRKNLLFCLNKKDKNNKFAIVFDNTGRVTEVRDPMQTDNAQSLYDESGLPTTSDLVGLAVGKKDHIETKRTENSKKDLLSKVEICIETNKRDYAVERAIQAEQNAFLAIKYKCKFNSADINIRTSVFNHAILSAYNEGDHYDSVIETETFIRIVNELYPEKSNDPNFCFGNEKIKQARDREYVMFKQKLMRYMEDDGHLGEINYAPEMIKNDPEVIETCKRKLIAQIVDGNFRIYDHVPENIQNDETVVKTFINKLLKGIEKGARYNYDYIPDNIKYKKEFISEYKKIIMKHINDGIFSTYQNAPEYIVNVA